MAKEKHYDRVKAIERASRADAGPHGKADAYRREKRTTSDWLAKAEEGETMNDLNKFPWNLHEGDEVFWKDPYKGTRPKGVVIHQIEFHGVKGDPNCILQITDADGVFLECFARELS